MKTNMNEVARLVTLDEGGKKNLNIGDVKEVLRRLRDRCVKPINGNTFWWCVMEYLRYSKSDALKPKHVKRKPRGMR